MKNKGIAILQPEVPHYREEFFELLGKKCETMYMYTTRLTKPVRTDLR